MIVRPGKFALMALGAVSLAACSGGGTRPGATPPPPAADHATEVSAIADLLDRGEERAARKRLKALLKRDPMNPQALLLADSLDRDPGELLGPQSHPYTVRSGDTIQGLAQRLLGNRLKAYQLGRYNDLKAPVALVPGQTIRIPGEPPRVEPVRRPDAARPTPTRPKPSVAKPSVPKPGASVPGRPAANPVAARAARAAGLTALNQGAVPRALALLRRAAALDPGNPLIARDLARAERIGATVRARR